MTRDPPSPVRRSKLLYRVQYPETATIEYDATECDAPGLYALSTEAAVSEDNFLMHISWDVSLSSPLIGLLGDRGHAENWARCRIRKGQSDECELLEIDVTELAAAGSVFKASDLIKYWGIEEDIPEKAKGCLQNEYLVFNHVPATAIVSREWITSGSPGDFHEGVLAMLARLGI